MHLYAKYLTDKEVEEIREHLKLNGLVVDVNQHDLPSSVNSSTLLYSPLIKNRDAVNKTQAVVEVLGWSNLAVEALVADNHWYSKNNLALMLLPKTAESRSDISLLARDMSRIYKSENCQVELTLNLAPDGRYSLDYSHVANVVKKPYQKGFWRVRQLPYLEMVSDDKEWWLYFEIINKTITDKVSEVDLTELVPVSDYIFPAGCTLLYGQRKPVK